jgi:hypothetical protein
LIVVVTVCGLVLAVGIGLRCATRALARHPASQAGGADVVKILADGHPAKWLLELRKRA